MSFSIKAQGFKEKSFHKMINTMLSHTVNEVYAKDLEYDTSVVYLDAREISEYNVSRIENAQWVGYDDFDLSRVEDIDKSKKIVVYCSLGIRSETVAHKLIQEGYTNVYNLYGGIFEWKNADFKVIDTLGKSTEKVHTFNKSWSKWLKKGEKVY